MKRVYYARAVDDRNRAEVLAEAIRIQGELVKYEIQLVDPVAIGGERERLPEEVVQTDLSLLKSCDAVLMDMSIDRWTYVGCVGELVYAHIWNIPSVVWVANKSIAERKWLLYHATRIVLSKKQAYVQLLVLLGLQANDMTPKIP